MLFPGGSTFREKLGKLPKLPRSDLNWSFKRVYRGWRSSGPQQFHPQWRKAPRMLRPPSQQTSLRRWASCELPSRS